MCSWAASTMTGCKITSSICPQAICWQKRYPCADNSASCSQRVLSQPDGSSEMAVPSAPPSHERVTIPTERRYCPQTHHILLGCRWLHVNPMKVSGTLLLFPQQQGSAKDVSPDGPTPAPAVPASEKISPGYACQQRVMQGCGKSVPCATLPKCALRSDSCRSQQAL